MEKLLKGKILSEPEQNACADILEQLLHARRRERYALQEPIQLQSAFKEIAMYYGKAILKMNSDELASVDHSMIVSNTYTDFVSGFDVPLAAARKQKVLLGRSADIVLPASNPFDQKREETKATNVYIPTQG